MAVAISFFRGRKAALVLIVMLLAWATGSVLRSAQAGPAPWFWWHSQRDGQRVCAQFMPRSGWTQGQGPFDNPRCEARRQSLIHIR